MTRIPTFKSLSEPRRKILKVMQTKNFGTIVGVVMLNNEPMFTDETYACQTIKMGGENGPRQEAQVEDFCLKAKQLGFLQALDGIQNGIPFDVDFRYGLPENIKLREKLRA